MVTRKRFQAAVAASAALLLAVSACSQGSTTKEPEAGGSSSAGPANIKIAYQQWGPGTVMKNFLAGVEDRVRGGQPRLEGRAPADRGQ